MEYSVIFYVHRTSEAADYITLKTEGNVVKVDLYHCKATKGKNSNSDVYEVAQQFIKSTVWIKSKSSLLKKLLSRIKDASGNKFVRGDVKTLKELLKSQKSLEVTIFIVQLAISKFTPMKDYVGTVLSATSFYIRNTGRAKQLKIIGGK